MTEFNRELDEAKHTANLMMSVALSQFGEALSKLRQASKQDGSLAELVADLEEVHSALSDAAQIRWDTNHRDKTRNNAVMEALRDFLEKLSHAWRES